MAGPRGHTKVLLVSGRPGDQIDDRLGPPLQVIWPRIAATPDEPRLIELDSIPKPSQIA
jgi:hypothetical protein